MKSARDVSEKHLFRLGFTNTECNANADTLASAILADRRAVVELMKDAYGDRAYNDNRDDVDAAVKQILEKGENDA